MSGRYREFDEDKALQEAAEVFWLKGYEATSTEDLLEAMQLNKGSMYNAFGNKRELFLKAFHWFGERFIHQMKAIFEKHDNPKEAIREIFMNVARATDPALHAKGCFYVNILGEMSGMDKDLVRTAQQKLIEVETLFYKEIKKGIEQKQFAKDTNARALARYLVNCWNGLSITRRLYGRAQLEELVRMNLNILN